MCMIIQIYFNLVHCTYFWVGLTVHLPPLLYRFRQTRTKAKQSKSCQAARASYGLPNKPGFYINHFKLLSLSLPIGNRQQLTGRVIMLIGIYTQGKKTNRHSSGVSNSKPELELVQMCSCKLIENYIYIYEDRKKKQETKKR